MKSKAEELPNMPKYQPCPMCGHSSKRQDKTVSGANYRCPNHGEFFVGRLRQ